MNSKSIVGRIMQPENISNPYALYAELRRTPVVIDEGSLSEGRTYVLSAYEDVAALLQDPRLSSDARKRQSATRTAHQGPVFFSELDNPQHDEDRGAAMRHFGPPHNPGFVAGLSGRIAEIAEELIDEMASKNEVDFIKDFAYPLPIMAICEVLGVPHEDEGKFHKWISAAVQSVPRSEQTESQKHAVKTLSEYIGSLVEAKRKEPTDDLISGLVGAQGDAGMSDEQIIMTSVGLLSAGHETTVNLIANGIVTFMRHPEAAERIREEPELIIPGIEELLRFEPPVQIVPGRQALDDITVAGVTIPRGSVVAFAIAAANRDPSYFEDPDAFIPDRKNNAHLGFGSGVHYCFGAPLARLEGQIALQAFLRRIQKPRLLQDPPPYRESAVLRGPSELRIAFERVRPRD